MPLQKKKKNIEEQICETLRRGNQDEIRLLIKEGWDPTSGSLGFNPLSIVQTTKTAQYLIDAGVDVNAAFRRNSPILFFSSNGPIEMVDCLIKAGADVDARLLRRHRYDSDTPKGRTPLVNAIVHGKIPIAELLLKAGANVNLCDERNRNALFYAALYGQYDFAKKLVASGSMLTEDVLCGPVRHGNVEMLRLLIKKGANVNYTFGPGYEFSRTWPKGETLLGCAIGKINHVETDGGKVVIDYPSEIAKILIESGADVNQPSRWFSYRSNGVLGMGPVPPVRIAGSMGLEDVMDWLWKAGAKSTLQEAVADCVLERAAYRNSPSIVRLLIKAGVDVNAPGKETGRRPIELAQEKGNLEIVKLLKEAGARD